MRCEKVQNQLAAYVFGELDADTERNIGEHLAHCSDCPRALEEVRVAAGTLQDAFESESAPVLDEERRAAITAERTESVEETSASAAEKRRVMPGPATPWLRLVLPAAATLAIAALLAGLLGPRGREKVSGDPRATGESAPKQPGDSVLAERMDKKEGPGAPTPEVSKKAKRKPPQLKKGGEQLVAYARIKPAESVRTVRVPADAEHPAASAPAVDASGAEKKLRKKKAYKKGSGEQSFDALSTTEDSSEKIAGTGAEVEAAMEADAASEEVAGEKRDGSPAPTAKAARKKAPEPATGEDKATEAVSRVQQRAEKGEVDQKLQVQVEKQTAQNQMAKAERMKDLDTTAVQKKEASARLVQQRPLKEAVFRPSPTNAVMNTPENPVSTFALNNDTASYSIVRHYLQTGRRAPAAAVRPEAFLNATNISSSPSDPDEPLTVYAEAGQAPFHPSNHLLKINVHAKPHMQSTQRRAAHVVLLVHVSGAMELSGRALMKYALTTAVNSLVGQDRVTVIVCRNSPAVLAESISVANAKDLQEQISRLQPQPEADFAAGLRRAYRLAREHYREKSVNRILVFSDGKAEPADAAAAQMAALDETPDRRKVHLTTVGFGSSAYNDRILDQLAERGGGQYVFVDSQQQARKLFAEKKLAASPYAVENLRFQMSSNKKAIGKYRLIGYANRNIAETEPGGKGRRRGGVLPAGSTATVLYEIELKDAYVRDVRGGAESVPLGTVSLRYSIPRKDRAETASFRLPGKVLQERNVENAPGFYVTACAAELAEILRKSEYSSLEKLEKVIPVLTDVVHQFGDNRTARELLKLAHWIRDLYAENKERD